MSNGTKPANFFPGALNPLSRKGVSGFVELPITMSDVPLRYMLRSTTYGWPTMMVWAAPVETLEAGTEDVDVGPLPGVDVPGGKPVGPPPVPDPMTTISTSNSKA